MHYKVLLYVQSFNGVEEIRDPLNGEAISLAYENIIYKACYDVF